MLISEQKYANKNRLYYRGLANNDKSSKFYKETYLTTRLIYALAYSFGLKGIVEVYRLKDTANIFNMRSKTDESRYEELKNVIKKLNKQKIIKEQKEKEEKYLDNIRKRISGRSKGLFC